MKLENIKTPNPGGYSIYHKFSNAWNDPAVKTQKIGIPFYNVPKIGSGDKIYVILPEEEGRPDLLSLKFYGTTDLDWFICIANHIKDPFSEIVAGLKIAVPSIFKFNNL